MELRRGKENKLELYLMMVWIHLHLWSQWGDALFLTA